MKIFKDFSFEAAHYLPLVPPTHKCRKLHGHSYKVRIYLEGEPDAILGWIMDFADLKAIVLPVILQLDHQCLNNVSGLENPTAEILAKWLWDKIKPILPLLTEIQVNETNESGCIYFGIK